MVIIFTLSNICVMQELKLDLSNLITFGVFGLSHFHVGEADNIDSNHDNDGDEDDVETCFHNPFSRLAVSLVQNIEYCLLT